MKLKEDLIKFGHTGDSHGVMGFDGGMTFTEDELADMDDKDLYNYLREMWAMSAFVEGELGIELAKA
jgi:hypothetical protein|tara:strand:- start:176 stop:376 length:201 start_codon:yes stop_codon:yes gene_type:complete